MIWPDFSGYDYTTYTIPPEPLCAALSAAAVQADPNQGRPVAEADAAKRRTPGGNYSHPLACGTEAAETRHPP